MLLLLIHLTCNIQITYSPIECRHRLDICSKKEITQTSTDQEQINILNICIRKNKIVTAQD